jgi:hypothetical protein
MGGWRWMLGRNDKYGFGDGLAFNIIKLKQAMHLYGDTPCCKVVFGNKLGIHRRQYQKKISKDNVPVQQRHRNQQEEIEYLQELCTVC